MTTANEIRQALKEAGYNSRQVTVRKRAGGLSTSFILTIRCPFVNPDTVEEIEKRFSHVRWDNYTGEVLGGGNTFTDTVISQEVREEWASSYLDKVTAAAEQLEAQGEDYNAAANIDNRFAMFKTDHGRVNVSDEMRGGFLQHPYIFDKHGLKALAADLFKLRMFN